VGTKFRVFFTYVFPYKKWLNNQFYVKKKSSYIVNYVYDIPPQTLASGEPMNPGPQTPTIATAPNLINIILSPRLCAGHITTILPTKSHFFQFKTNIHPFRSPSTQKIVRKLPRNANFLSYCIQAWNENSRHLRIPGSSLPDATFLKTTKKRHFFGRTR